jgi:hypothetical protein
MGLGKDLRIFTFYSRGSPISQIWGTPSAVYKIYMVNNSAILSGYSKISLLFSRCQKLSLNRYGVGPIRTQVWSIKLSSNGFGLTTKYKFYLRY